MNSGFHDISIIKLQSRSFLVPSPLLIKAERKMETPHE
jgi:hypothetical protein